MDFRDFTPRKWYLSIYKDYFNIFLRRVTVLASCKHDSNPLLLLPHVQYLPQVDKQLADAPRAVTQTLRAVANLDVLK